MIRTFKIFLSDMRRIRSNVVAIVIILGLAVIPALYAWFNIMSNWDPYGENATSQMKIAVFSEDAGVEIEGIKLNVGDKVIEGLRENTTICWVFSYSGENALEGVDSGEYYAGIIIPEDFTGKMISFLGGEPENPSIEYYENSKKNAIATKITGKAKTAVQEEINATFVSTLTKVLTESGEMLSQADNGGLHLLDTTVEKIEETNQNLQTYADILGTLSLVTDSASDLADSAQSLLFQTQGLINDGQDSLAGMQQSVNTQAQTADAVSSLINISLDSVDQDLMMVDKQIDAMNVGSAVSNIKDSVDTVKKVTESTIATLKDILGENHARVTSLVRSYQQFKKDVNTLTKDSTATAKSLKMLKNTLKADITECRNSIHSIKNSFQYEINPNVDRAVVEIQDSLIQAGMLLNSMEKSFGDIDRSLEAYQTTLDSGTENITKTRDYIISVKDSLAKLAKKIRELGNDKQYQDVLDMLENDPQMMADFVESPVTMETERIYPIETYGSAMAPFYTVLAIWVGALIMVALIHVKVKGNHTPYAFFGRYLTFFLIGQAQTAIIVLGDLFFVEIQCPHPFLFWLAGAASSLVFTLLIYSLTVAMGNVGEAIAVVIMVIQVAGAGGTFPVEVLPQVYQMLYKFLPFTYCMNAMRECVGGMYGYTYWQDLKVLGIYVIISLVIGLVVSVPFRKLNKMIERSKEKSKVMV